MVNKAQKKYTIKGITTTENISFDQYVYSTRKGAEKKAVSLQKNDSPRIIKYMDCLIL